MPIIRPYRTHWPTIHPSAFVAENAVLIGQVTIGPHASVWYGCVLRGDVAPIVVGEATNIQDGTIIHAASLVLNGREIPTRIGSRVTVGHMALLHACTVEDGAFVGMRSCLMDGVVVESEAMVAAGALVSPGKRVGSRQLWVGSPAQFKRLLTDEELAYLPHSAAFYAELAQEYCSPPPLVPDRA